jgi:hypothetical protein
MPATAIWEMKIVDNQVVIATHGRGIWSVAIAELPGQVYLPKILIASPSLAGELLFDVEMKSAFDSTHVYIDDVLFAKLNQATAQGTLTITTNYSSSQNGEVFVRSYFRGKPYVSHKFSFQLFDYNTTVDSYENDFNTANADFNGVGFTETTAPNFTTRALHTPHLYSINANYHYTLLSPIRVKATNAFINFREVALVETGLSGALPGTPDFNDYVVVQGSTDGINWQNLLDEYDASSHSDWEEAIGSGTGDLLKFRAIDLLNTFQANDEILVRFVLRSNSTINHWGWAIDNLRIQTDNVIAGIDREQFENSFSVYPNPVNGLSINIANPKQSSNSLIKMYSNNGQLVISQRLQLNNKASLKIPLHIRDGIYNLVIITGDSSEHHKIIIHRN